MSKYELVYLVAPDTPEERQADIAERLKSYIQQLSGTLESLDLWEKRRLAYEIKKFQEAFYFVARFEGDGKLVDELERRLRVADEVIRFITIRKDDEIKIMEKRQRYYKSRREGLEKRKKKSPPPAERQDAGHHGGRSRAKTENEVSSHE
ncbi:MAG TPA: 30S ribosomal protein S6 [Acidobacteriota bacterium]|nr:30S ribosomal protein S6 [Acidobacteriota bacterium]HNR37885.1 30S ribosomal protein S6 [Acidobacteriota bacterium]HNT99548.1 30S ribosomal protein S6 [Acidobacteriota bacterium]HPB26802.1 30S ribosomal protein S6 [Acidobacteriota bacterium]HQO24325.1 30S ribosomal protein S6 [Acidobacteriota bacterium]